MTDVLETERLVLWPLRIEDAARAQVLFPHWEIVKFLNAIVPWPYPTDGALTYYREVALPAVARGEQWHWTLRLKSSPEDMIGAIGLMQKAVDHRGFWLGVTWQRQGLMMEAVEVATSYWFDVLGFSVLRASKAVGNTASRRISEMTGMRLVGTEMRDYVSGRLPGEIWEITAEEWRVRRRRSL
ncbi:MAG: GNAT family N-acetyltransferase [Silvibacterium sp.]